MTTSSQQNLDGTRIEIIDPHFVRGRFRHVLFDFDGTISLIRTGWQDVMVPMMVDVLAAQPGTEERTTLQSVVREYVDTLTGKQTIYQMMRLAEEVERRGGKPRDSLEYKAQYHELLWAQIKHRRKALEAGAVEPSELMVPGTLDLLHGLRERGCTLYLASGTDEPYVLDEARALGVTECFDGGIYGALDDYKRFSKAKIIAGIFAQHGLHGPELLSFGDGYVEIENTREVGGIAIGVASDEQHRTGIDEWKRNRLIGAGAQVIIPDYRDVTALLDYLFTEVE